MTSTQERNTMAPQCSRKWKAKLIVPIYFGTKTSKLCLRIFFLFITGVRVKFRFERLRNKLRSSEHVRKLGVKSLLGALGAICNISSDDGEDLFADELFVYKEWKARYEVEEQENEK